VYFPRVLVPRMVEHARARSIDVLASVTRVTALENELALLTTALDERLEAINDLTRTAEERLAIIEELTAALKAIESRSPTPAPDV